MKRRDDATGWQRTELGHHHRGELGDRPATHATEPRFQIRIAHDLTVDRHGIESAAETRRLARFHRRTHPHGIVIHDRGLRRRATHIPRARDRFSIDPTTDARGLAEAIRHRDVVPTRVGRETGFRRPTMPMRVRLFRRRSRRRIRSRASRCSEKKVHPKLAAHRAHPQRPVLIVGREPRRTRASLADDIELIVGLEPVDLHPRFKRDRVAIRKIEHAPRPWVGQCEVPAGAIEPQRGVVTVEVGKLWRARSRRVTLDCPHDHRARRIFLAKIPARHRSRHHGHSI